MFLIALVVHWIFIDGFAIRGHISGGWECRLRAWSSKGLFMLKQNRSLKMARSNACTSPGSRWKPFFVFLPSSISRSFPNYQTNSSNLAFKGSNSFESFLGIFESQVQNLAKIYVVICHKGSFGTMPDDTERFCCNVIIFGSLERTIIE